MIEGNLNKITSDMAKISNQISSGQQMTKISDDPDNLVSALRFRSSISELNQYTENITNGNTIITASEAALSQMKNLTLRAKTLAIQAVDPALTSNEHLAIAEEIKNIFEQVVILGNSQVNGKYLFGGYKTTGYSVAEPAPFIIDKGDGHWINGTMPSPINTALTSTAIATAASAPGDIASGDFVINGINIGAVDLDTPALDVAGLNMGGAFNLKTSINTAFAAITPAVAATLTTLTSGSASLGAAAVTPIAFTINAVAVSYDAAIGGPAASAQEAVDAINLVSGLTGVTAELGTSTNGGAANSVVLKNQHAGDESAITLAGLDAGETAVTGLADADSAAADATHNTGQISLSSSASFTITNSNAVIDDTILNKLGLAGGGVGVYDIAGDGQLIYGPSPIGTGELKINGITIDPPVADATSTIYADSSAEAKAAAINLASTSRTVAGQIIPGTSVTAAVIPATFSTTTPVQAGTIRVGDLTINGIDIFAVSSPILLNDQDNALVTAINSATIDTGVKATRNSTGQLILTAVDGRNVQVQTSANGEAITNLTAGGYDRVYFGSLQLRSDREFTLETTDPTVNPNEPGLAALGLIGGETITGEPDDTAADGRINVFSIHNRTGTVRYAGDKENNLEIKIGGIDIMTVGINGQDGIADSTIFTSLKQLEDALRNTNFTSVTGFHSATSTTTLLDSAATGLEETAGFNPFTSGTFTITVSDHDTHPPSETLITLAVDPAVDTLENIAQRIDGVPNISASWTADGKLEITADDPDRYTFILKDDTSNFLKNTGVDASFMQQDAFQQAISNFDSLMENLTEHISTLGARANRIDVQSQIYSSLLLTTHENLSEMQDTDMIKAIMDLKSKEVAYQAALSAAAKTMQLSLVDYL